MNYSTALFLFNDKLRAVNVSYDPTCKNEPLVVFKTLDPDTKPGDFVVVPTETRHKMTVVKVVDVDVDVDFESTVKMEWIIGRVDRASYEETLTQEGRAIAKMKSAEAHKKREELKNAMFAEHAASFADAALIAAPAALADGTG